MHSPDSEHKIRVCFSLPKDTRDTFRGTCQRLGVDMSATLTPLVERFNQANANSSPQLKILHFSDAPKEAPLIKVVCPLLDGVFGGEVHCKRAGGWMQVLGCLNCERNSLRRVKK